MAVVWAVAISLAIYATSAVSGTHINPAITVAMAVHRGFPRRKVIPYVAGQFCGAFLAALVLFILFSGLLSEFETGALAGAAGYRHLIRPAHTADTEGADASESFELSGDKEHEDR